MPIEEQIPKVLEYVNIAKWGERRARTLRLVAQLSMPGYLVEIGPELLAVATDRSIRQAKYDHGVMKELAGEYRVLHRRAGSGRRPDAWSINPVSAWRGVPFVPSRSVVLRLFCGPESAEGVALWYKTAGQAVALRTGRGQIQGFADPLLSVNHLSSTPQHLSSTPQVERGETGQPVLYATASAPPSPFELLSEFTPSLSPSDPQRESESEDDNVEAGRRLLEAVRASVRTPVTGTMAGRIVRVGQAHPEMVDALADYARAHLGWVKTAVKAAELIEEEVGRLGAVVAANAERAARARAVADCPRCDHKGLVLLDDCTVMRCDHEVPAPTGAKA